MGSVEDFEEETSESVKAVCGDWVGHTEPNESGCCQRCGATLAAPEHEGTQHDDG